MMFQINDILAFDFAEDIKEEWDSYMEDGCTISEATTQLIEQYEEMLEDEEKMMLYITLGLLQIDLEGMDARVKEEVHEILGTKCLEEYFEDSKECKRTLQVLKKRCR